MAKEPRIYTQVRIAHKTQEEKDKFEAEIRRQSTILTGKPDKAAYVRQMVNLNYAEKVINKLSEEDK